MKKLFLAVTVLAFIILVLLLFHFQKYSIVDIDADNYEKMKQIDDAVLCVDYFDLPNEVANYMSQPQKLVSKPGLYEVSVEKNSNGTIAVYIHSDFLRLNFSMRLRDETSICPQYISMKDGTPAT